MSVQPFVTQITVPVEWNPINHFFSRIESFYQLCHFHYSIGDQYQALWLSQSVVNSSELWLVREPVTPAVDLDSGFHISL